MTRIILAVSMLLTTSCSIEGEAYHCWDERGQRDLNATARLSALSGEVLSYEAIDPNGLTIEISSENSHQYVCTPWRVVEEQQRKAAEEHAATCASVRQKADEKMTDDEIITKARCDAMDRLEASSK